ncbi:TPA: ABC transporter ATP-binding protein [Candidatus Poribacteria bacterium]|nr:ABC transporter ATP-binding protein [Candidatus Poribacteria bacterium]
MLRVQSLTAGYGKITVIRGISIHVRPGEVVALIGSNGAGKTSLLKSITGLITPKSGKILFDEREITGLPPERIVKLGISMVPEGRRIFAPLSVMDNLLLGAYPRYSRKIRDEVFSRMREVFGIFPILSERRHQIAGTLSGGEQQMLAIGRALMSDPKLLLLDEPSMGLAPKVAAEIFKVIATLKERGVTILLVEQNAKAALRIADRGYVMETGRIVLEGTPRELESNRDIVRAYLGRGYRRIYSPDRIISQ